MVQHPAYAKLSQTLIRHVRRTGDLRVQAHGAGMLAQRGAAQPRNLPMSSLHEKTGWPPAVEGTLLTPGQPPKRTTPRGVRRDAARAIGYVPLATAGLSPADGRPGYDRGRLIGHIPCLKQRKPLATRHPHLAWISVRPCRSSHPHK